MVRLAPGRPAFIDQETPGAEAPKNVQNMLASRFTLTVRRDEGKARIQPHYGILMAVIDFSAN